MIYQGPERRRYKRMKCSFMTRIGIYKENQKPEEYPKWNVVTLRNLGAGGICFNYSKRIELGTALKLIIELPKGIDSARCLGEVCRVDEPIQSARYPRKIPIYGIATQFTEIEAEEKNKINKFVESSYLEEKRNR